MVTIPHTKRTGDDMANIKMKDVAKAAGVSVTTVGRVLHNNGYVAADKREKIEAVIKELGFVPNKLAQGLKRQESRIIGHMTVFNMNMLYEQISAAINETAAKENYTVLTMTSHTGRNDEAKIVEELLGHRVDGIIITSNSFIDPKLIEKLTDQNMPVVMIERTLDLPKVDRVIIDDLSGARDAVLSMIDKGHKDIAYIGCRTDHEVEQLRLDGYLTALKSHNISIPDNYKQLTPYYGVDTGYQSAKNLMEGPKPPTAIFATADTYLCGILQYFYEKNIKVPEDVALIGYDDTLSRMMAPPISSMALPHEVIGREAMNLMLRRIKDAQAPARKVIVSPMLVDRKTVKRI